MAEKLKSIYRSDRSVYTRAKHEERETTVKKLVAAVEKKFGAEGVNSLLRVASTRKKELTRGVHSAVSA